jgi:N-methylhydantoinase A/oxoprolinase/acetone carboxylase beta subunit
VVVKGDGTLISASTAREKPIETILSGPAASVAGARYLTHSDDALVVDMGGTTTDTASLSHGNVRTSQRGARVGKYHTHVQALDMRTAGLGGDSLLSIAEGELRIGPGRVVPVACLGATQSGVSEALDYLQQRADHLPTVGERLQIISLTGRRDEMDYTDEQEAILQALQERPRSIPELASIADANLFGLKGLVEHSVVQRCGLTPTDLLHVSGEFRRWDCDAATRMCELVSSLLGFSRDELVEHMTEQVVRQLAVELLKKLLDEEVESDAMDDCPVCQVLLKNWLNKDKKGLRFHVTLDKPIIGIGAPVHLFLPKAARRLGAEHAIPLNADVANAIGAITSEVLIIKHAKINQNRKGGFAVEGLPGGEVFEDFDMANAFALHELVKVVREMGRHAGTSETQVEAQTEDSIVRSALGEELFLGRTITARLRGRPNIAILTE